MNETKIGLKPVERAILKEKHQSTGKKKKADRIKVILFLDNGFSYKETADAMMLDKKTVRRIRYKYQKEGIDNFLSDNYQSYCGKLTKEEENEIKQYVLENIVNTAAEVMEHIKTKCNKDYSVEGVVKLLKRLGFVYKKTKLVPAKADKNKQEEFVKAYDKLKSELKSDETIYFADGVHPQHNSKPAYAWIEKGKDKEIKSNTGRERININGAYSPENQEVITVEAEMINAQATISLYEKIEAKETEKRIVYVIRDNAKYYDCELVKEYLKTSKIVEIALPTYSPNLNLIERLWKFFKKKVINNKYYEKFTSFKDAVRKFFNEDWDIYRKEIKTLITEKFQIIGATK